MPREVTQARAGAMPGSALDSFARKVEAELVARGWNSPADGGWELFGTDFPLPWYRRAWRTLLRAVRALKLGI